MLVMDQTATAAACLGLASHLVFIRGEWHLQAPSLVVLYSALFWGITAYLNVKQELPFLAAYYQACLLSISYAAGLFSSIVAYRIWFHPLRAFPGPRFAALTKFWHVVKCRDSRNHTVVDELHRQYGDIVRTGPNELTVLHPEILNAINGSGSACTKAALYDLTLPAKGINVTRNPKEHDWRRRVWDPAFTIKSLQDYHPRVVKYGKQLDQAIARLGDADFDANDWFYWFSFDVMGDLALGRSFKMIEDARWHDSIAVMREGLDMLGMFTPIPWFCRIGFSIPGAAKGWKTMNEWCTSRMKERLKMYNENDICHYLIKGSKIGDSDDLDWNWLNGDALAVITAGSDTVACTLVFIFNELALHREEQIKLEVELAEVPDLEDSKALQSLPHLNALINETLRLHPVVPTGGYRVVGPQGLVIGKQFIPPETIISGPRWSLGRMENCFQEASKFIPERWYSWPEMIKDKRPFSPFSQGRYTCIGKNLATMELRYVVSLLVSKYSIEFAPGFERRACEDGMKDQFAAVPGPLKLRFRPRIVS